MSVSTVSRALNDYHQTSLETKQKVREKAKQLRYVANEKAQSLRTGKVQTIALLVMEHSNGESYTIPLFLQRLIAATVSECNKQGYDTLLFFQVPSQDWLTEFVLNHKADSIIFIGYQEYCSYAIKLQQLVDAGIPFTFWGAQTSEQFSYVCYDNFYAGQLIAKHLNSQARKNWLFIGDVDNNYPENQSRYQGLCSTQKSDVSISVISWPGNNTNFLNKLKAYLNKHSQIDALICSTDEIALYICNENDVNVSSKTIIGFDDLYETQLVTPTVTTVRQEIKLAAKALVSSLMTQITSANTSQIMLTPELIVRET